MANLGAWNVDEMKGCNLPQKVASAFTAVTGELVGADYMPVLYVGSQDVNGRNYSPHYPFACTTRQPCSV